MVKLGSHGLPMVRHDRKVVPRVVIAPPTAPSEQGSFADPTRVQHALAQLPKAAQIKFFSHNTLTFSIPPHENSKATSHTLNETELTKLFAQFKRKVEPQKKAQPPKLSHSEDARLTEDIEKLFSVKMGLKHALKDETLSIEQKTTLTKLHAGASEAIKHALTIDTQATQHLQQLHHVKTLTKHLQKTLETQAKQRASVAAVPESLTNALGHLQHARI